MRAAVALVLAATPAAAEVIEAGYICEGGATIDAVYVNGAPEGPVAVIQVEGQLVALTAEPAASGARYAGGRHVWWTKGDEATLYWRDPETTIEEPIRSGCLRQG